MNERDGNKTLGLGSRARNVQVTQNFSHGRKKSVVVEDKRNRILAPKKSVKNSMPVVERKAWQKRPQAMPVSAPTPETNTISDGEMNRRRQAIETARARETADEAKRVAEEQKRIEERLKRLEKIAKEEEIERERIKAEQEKKQAQAKEKIASENIASTKRIKKSPQKTTETDAKPPASARHTPTPEREERSLREQKGQKGNSERRRSGKLTLNQALSGSDEGRRQRSLASVKRQQERARQKAIGKIEKRSEKIVRDVQIPEAIVVQELANRMAERVSDVVKALITNGVMVTQNQTIDADTAELIVSEFGHHYQRVSASDVEDVIDTIEDNPSSLKPRPPIITVMGHVDHGKTSLLDTIRKTKVVKGEAGGITQHIGAYQSEDKGGNVMTFLDTPGHSAFTSMRARGTQVTDIVILVVAADDSVMPQTIEAINHTKVAKVPIIIAINKIDKPEANPDKVRTELLNHGIVVEKMSGDVLDVEVSAKTGKGLDELMENILLQAELLELKANPDRPARGAVIEAQLDVGRGPIATILVQNGTLNQGDVFVVGKQWGRARAMIDDKGKRIKTAKPSVPVEVLGLHGTPEAGDILDVVETEAQAREISTYRKNAAKEARAHAGTASSFEQLMAKAKDSTDRKDLAIVIKADVQGSAEAIVQAMEKIGNEEVGVRILHYSVGAITESDISLANASNAFVVGFNVRANAPARAVAHQKGIDIRYYSVIYDLVDDIKAAANGLLSATISENFIGYAKIKQVFRVSKIGRVAGCIVTEGIARRFAYVRLLRDNIVLHEGTLKTLKRFKDEVPEVQSGQECGMAFENYDDIRENDVIEIFEKEEIARKLA